MTGIDTSRGLRLNVADHALDAASEGTGVVLGYKLVASRDIGLGRLVSPFGPEVPLPGRAYHFVCAKGQEKRPTIKAFRDWLFAGDRGHLRQARLRCAAGGETRGRVICKRAGALGKEAIGTQARARKGGDDVRKLRIAAIPGDGIGQEVIAAGVRVLEACARRDGGFEVAVDHFDWGSERYKKTGAFMPADGLGADQGPRRHPVRLRGRARCARPHHAVGLAARHLPALRPVRQRATDPHPAGHHQPAADR